MLSDVVCAVAAEDVLNSHPHKSQTQVLNSEGFVPTSDHDVPDILGTRGCQTPGDGVISEEEGWHGWLPAGNGRHQTFDNDADMRDSQDTIEADEYDDDIWDNGAGDNHICDSDTQGSGAEDGHTFNSDTGENGPEDAHMYDSNTGENGAEDGHTNEGDMGDNGAGDSDTGDNGAGDSDTGDNGAGDSDTDDSDASGSDMGEDGAEDGHTYDSDREHGGSGSRDSDMVDSDDEDGTVGDEVGHDSDLEGSDSEDSETDGADVASSPETSGRRKHLLSLVRYPFLNICMRLSSIRPRILKGYRSNLRYACQSIHVTAESDLSPEFAVYKG